MWDRVCSSASHSVVALFRLFLLTWALHFVGRTGDPGCPCNCRWFSGFAMKSLLVSWAILLILKFVTCIQDFGTTPQQACPQQRFMSSTPDPSTYQTLKVQGPKPQGFRSQVPLILCYLDTKALNLKPFYLGPWTLRAMDGKPDRRNRRPRMARMPRRPRRR